jgi:hypothetical protein
MFQWNPKCVIQGGLLVGLYLSAAWGWGPTIDFAKRPLVSTAWVVLLFVMWYVLNAYLDFKFGCEHGTFYQDVLGW